MGLVINDQIWMVNEVHHVKPGKGAAFVRCRLKNLKTDLVQEMTFRASDKPEEATVEEKTIQFQYSADDTFHFMDQETFEDMTISRDQLGDSVNFLQDNMEVTAICHEGKLIKVVLPNFLITQIVATEPGFKGDSSKAGTKSAKIDTGASIQVPLFINIGDWVKIDTRDGQGLYVERVNK